MTQLKARQSCYTRRKVLLDNKLLDIHTFVTKKISDYVEDRKEECYRYVCDFDKEANEAGAGPTGISKKKKALAGKELYKKDRGELGRIEGAGSDARPRVS